MKTSKHKLSVIIPAAGAGKRMEREIPKILIPLNGKTILEHTIRGFFNVNVHEMIVPVSKEIHAEVEELCNKLDAPFSIRIVTGGAQRQDSIWNALKVLDKGTTIVAVHDAARPFFDPGIIDKAYSLLEKYDGVIAAVPATYTMKQVKNNTVEHTLSRELLWQINTPQIFHKEVLVSAYEKAYKDGFYGTDDAMLLERMGKRVSVINDIPHNIKITTPADLYSAEWIISKDKGVAMQRIGQGYDVHRLVEGRKLILGGVDIPHEKGLEGHSDADVLVHAIMDAILGAAALGDIGKHFPDTDDRYKNIDSMFLLYGIRKLMEVNGYSIQNIDATLILQTPKVAPYIEEMRKNIAGKLGVKLEQVSVKATTEEGLGFTGREEGAAAMAIAMLNRK
ncbi:MAG: 2-C-methyl-D-erythritol 2,4-cyclodiphosphate synthase [Candidatus Marinimicrobia bacterium]|nr:2-C-methyl-D-erythritol 2,4-cyclodiphosphate synthase [Candidatus Neomarinimicrobiota bacterium]